MPTLKPDMSRDDPPPPPSNNHNNEDRQPPVQHAPVVPHDHGQPSGQTREDLVREWINRRIQLSANIPGASTANAFSAPASSYAYDGVGGINAAVMNLQTENAKYLQSLNTVQQYAQNHMRQSLPQAPQGNFTASTAYETTPAQAPAPAPAPATTILPSELSGNSSLQEALKKKIAQKLQEKLKKMRPDMSDNDRAAALALLEGKDNVRSHSLNLVPKQQQDPLSQVELSQVELQTKYSQEGKLNPPQLEPQTKSAVPQQEHTTLLQSEDQELPQRMQVDKQNNDNAPPVKKKSPSDKKKSSSEKKKSLPISQEESVHRMQKTNDEKKSLLTKIKQGQNENAVVKATRKTVTGDNSKRSNDAKKITEAQPPAAKKRKTKSTPQQIAKDLDTVITNELSDNIRSIIHEDREGLDIMRREKLQAYEEQLAAMQSRLDMYTNLEGLAEQIADVRSGNKAKKRSLVDGAVDMIRLSLNNYQMLEDHSDRLLGIDEKNR